MRYDDIPILTKEEILEALHEADPEELKTIALSAALGMDDWQWAQAVCLQLATHPEPGVRGNAILGFGHLARRHRRLDRDRVEPAIRDALNDPGAFVRGHADSAAEDVAAFLGWQLT
jgi:hypothetical protein